MSEQIGKKIGSFVVVLNSPHVAEHQRMSQRRRLIGRWPDGKRRQVDPQLHDSNVVALQTMSGNHQVPVRLRVYDHAVDPTAELDAIEPIEPGAMLASIDLYFPMLEGKNR